MTEDLSALIDDELGEGLAEQTLTALLTDLEMHERWNAYHVIGDVLRQDAALQPRRTRDFGERLAAEPTVLCPGAARPRPDRVPMAWAAAAAVAGVAVVVGATLGLQPEVEGGRGPSEASELRGRSAALVPTASGQEYLLAHQAVSPRTALSGFPQYARTVAAARSEGVQGR